MSVTYVPDKPCARGHQLRYTKGGQCVECRKLQTKKATETGYYVKQRAADPERFKGYQDKWRFNNPAKKLYDSARNRAQLHGLDFNIEPGDVVIPSMCPVLDIPMVKPTLDRKFNHLGYVKGNVHVISHRANRLKSDATLDEVIAIARYMSLTD